MEKDLIQTSLEIFCIREAEYIDINDKKGQSCFANCVVYKVWGLIEKGVAFIFYMRRLPHLYPKVLYMNITHTFL